MDIVNLYLNFANKIPVWVLLLLSGLSVIAGDYYGKLWSTETKNIWLFIAFLGYFFSGFFYLPTLLRANLTSTSIIWSLISILGFLIIGLVIFKETLTSLQKIAAIFGTISLILFSFNR